MVIAVVGRPDKSKGFDGKVWIDWCCAEWKQAQRGSARRSSQRRTLLTPVMSLINDHNGGNDFKLPHTGIRKEMREDGWDI